MNTVRVLGFRYLAGRKTPQLYFWFLALRDQIFRALWGRTGQTGRAAAREVPLSNVLVSKLDHFGDLLMITPFLQELKRQRPGVRITLMIGSWNQSLAELLREANLCDAICHYDSPTLNRTTSKRLKRAGRFAKTALTTVSVLRQEKPDTFIDLRPYSPNSLFLARLLRIPFRVGFGLRGLAFTLHQTLSYDEVTPLGQLLLDALPAIGLKPAEYQGPYLPATNGPRADSERYVVFQPASGDPSKEIDLFIWSNILDILCPVIKVVMLGGKSDGPLGVRLGDRRSPGQFEVWAGKTTLREAVLLTEKSEGCIGVDSFFAHVGLAYSLPVFVLAVQTSHRLAFPKNNPELNYIEIENPNFVAEEIAKTFLDRISFHDAKSSLD